MFHPIVNSTQWAEKHQITTRSVNCPLCQKPLVFNQSKIWNSINK